jgi:hypothetical protein
MEITNVSFHRGGEGDEDTMLQRILLFWHGLFIPVCKRKPAVPYPEIALEP